TGSSPTSATSRSSPAHASHTSLRGTGTERASSGVPSSAATAAASLVPPTSRASAVMATTLSDGSASPQDQDQVADEELSDTGHVHEPPRPVRVVAGERREQFTVGCRTCPAQTVARADVEQRHPVPVLRFPAVFAGVAPGRVLAAEGVPRTGLVPAERPPPQGVRQHHQSAGTRDAQ